MPWRPTAAFGLSGRKNWSPRRFSKQYLQRSLQRHSASDEQDRASTYLLRHEGADYKFLWLAEVFTPVDIPQLEERLDSISKRRPPFANRPTDNYAHWLTQGRRDASEAWHALPYFARRGIMEMMPNRITTELPLGVDWATGGITLVTPSIAVAVISFAYSDSFAAGFGELTRRRESTSLDKFPGGYSLIDVPKKKALAVDAWHEARISEASVWLAQELPGFFSRGAGEPLPSIALISTRGFKAWEERRTFQKRLSPFNVLGLGYSILEPYWAVDVRPEIHVREVAHGAGLRAASLLATTYDAGDNASEDLQGELHHVLSEPMQSMMLRWALVHLVLRSRKRLNRLRDDIASIAGRASSRDFLTLRNELISIGADVRLAANEAATFARTERDWARHFPASTEVVPEAHMGKYAPESLLELWKSALLAETEQLTPLEKDFSELAGVSADLTNVAFGIRTQRAVLWLTIVSVIVAAASLLVAIVALRATSQPPSTSPSPSYSANANGAESSTS
ncbi:hypothetical protein [Streptacidiphilus melanogenes]|uniref:hypothetical protein n=1 Tax=Streptacidiphilus melanogenes TaxID=411235 RepID=UPI00126A3585|nr:hypothetical protein [Streptacidiphilus melanogenes]